MKTKLIENKFYNFFLFIIKKSLILYLLTFLLVSMLVDYKVVKLNSSVRSLNRLRPPKYDHLYEIQKNPNKVNIKELEKFAFYFKNITKNLPNRVDAYGMLGFCYYFLGKTEKAINSYQKAIEMYPNFLWFYHNLGIIYYKNKEYSKSAELFQRTMYIKPKDNLFLVYKSLRIYVPIIVSHAGENIEQFLKTQLKEGYKNSLKLLVASYYHLKDNTNMLNSSLYAINTGLDDDGTFRYFAGLSFYLKSKYPQALQYLKESIEINPKNPDAFKYLGLTLKALGQEGRSIAAIKKSELLNLTNEDVLSSINNINLQIY